MSSILLESKRIFRTVSRRQLFFIAGVFVLFSILTPAHVSARGTMFATTTVNKQDSVTELNQQKLEKINNLKQEEKNKLISNATKLKEIQQTIDQTSNAKNDLQNQIAFMQAQVNDLKQKIETKKQQDMIENSMTVHISSYSQTSEGNLYEANNCTWYVKSRRPDIGNTWGDAKNWYAAAQSEGFQVGSKAKTGAIGVKFTGEWGHVVYVEAWHSDGTVTISEMNYDFNGSLRTTTVPESDFVYIYAKP